MRKRKIRSDKGVFRKSPIRIVNNCYEAILFDRRKNIVGIVKFDYQDLNIVLQCRWHINTGYAYNRKNGLLHRLIMKPLRHQLVDHINFDRLDNRRSNLRLANNLQNVVHAKIPTTNTSGIKGVSWNKGKNKWKAYIFKNNKQIHLGYFDTKETAAIIRQKVAKEMYGEFYAG